MCSASVARTREIPNRANDDPKDALMR